jgi:hypothetical protein
VLQEFFKVRMMYYDRRKAHLAMSMTEDWEKLDNKVGVDESPYFTKH